MLRTTLLLLTNSASAKNHTAFVNKLQVLRTTLVFLTNSPSAKNHTVLLTNSASAKNHTDFVNKRTRTICMAWESHMYPWHDTCCVINSVSYLPVSTYDGKKTARNPKSEFRLLSICQLNSLNVFIFIILGQLPREQVGWSDYFSSDGRKFHRPTLKDEEGVGLNVTHVCLRGIFRVGISFLISDGCDTKPLHHRLLRL